MLNLFAIQSLFVSAAYGASEVHSVDLSAVYLKRAEKNFEKNGLSIDEHFFVEGDLRFSIDIETRRV